MQLVKLMFCYLVTSMYMSEQTHRLSPNSENKIVKRKIFLFEISFQDAPKHSFNYNIIVVTFTFNKTKT